MSALEQKIARLMPLSGLVTPSNPVETPSKPSGDHEHNHDHEDGENHDHNHHGEDQEEPGSSWSGRRRTRP